MCYKHLLGKHSGSCFAYFDPKKCTFKAKLDSILTFMLITCNVQKIYSSNYFPHENMKKKLNPNLPQTNKSTKFI